MLCTMISIDLTDKFHSLYVKESESEILGRSESGVGFRYFTSDSATLVESQIFFALISRFKNGNEHGMFIFTAPDSVD